MGWIFHHTYALKISVARNVQVLATEMFKVYKNMSTEIMQGHFCVRQTYYNLRNPHHFAVPSINSVNKESI